MKLLVLTTKTQHHDFFNNNIYKKYPNLDVIYEEKKPKFSFQINNKSIKLRDKYEKIYFKNKYYKNNIKKHYVKSINSNKCIRLIKKINPRIIIVFGTSILKNKTISLCKNSYLINLHGGNPNYYRGLDSHFWSLYHKDFKNIVTTLHFIDRGIDTGNIIEMAKISLNNKVNFNNLRIKNVENCINLTINFCNKVNKKLKIQSKKQKVKGRYYSAFPSIFINIIMKNLKVYLSKK